MLLIQKFVFLFSCVKLLTKQVKPWSFWWYYILECIMPLQIAMWMHCQTIHLNTPFVCHFWKSVANHKFWTLLKHEHWKYQASFITNTYGLDLHVVHFQYFRVWAPLHFTFIAFTASSYASMRAVSSHTSLSSDCFCNQSKCLLFSPHSPHTRNTVTFLAFLRQIQLQHNLQSYT